MWRALVAEMCTCQPRHTVCCAGEPMVLGHTVIVSCSMQRVFILRVLENIRQPRQLLRHSQVGKNLLSLIRFRFASSHRKSGVGDDPRRRGCSTCAALHSRTRSRARGLCLEPRLQLALARASFETDIVR